MADTVELTPDDDAPLTSSTDALDPDPSAPYGRTDDGTLLDRKGKRAPYGLTKSGLRKAHPPRKPRPPTASSGRPSGRTITVKRRNGLRELTELPKGILLGIGYKTGNTALLADGVTIDMHAPMVADALAELADDNDQLARVVDRLIEVGPMASLGMALGGMVAQLARNHGALPPQLAAMLGGANDPEQLAQMATSSLEAAAEAVQHEAAGTNGS